MSQASRNWLISATSRKRSGDSGLSSRKLPSSASAASGFTNDGTIVFNDDPIPAKIEKIASTTMMTFASIVALSQTYRKSP